METNNQLEISKTQQWLMENIFIKDIPDKTWDIISARFLASCIEQEYIDMPVNKTLENFLISQDIENLENYTIFENFRKYNHPFINMVLNNSPKSKLTILKNIEINIKDYIENKAKINKEKFDKLGYNFYMIYGINKQELTFYKLSPDCLFTLSGDCEEFNVYNNQEIYNQFVELTKTEEYNQSYKAVEGVVYSARWQDGLAYSLPNPLFAKSFFENIFRQL